MERVQGNAEDATGVCGWVALHNLSYNNTWNSVTLDWYVEVKYWKQPIKEEEMNSSFNEEMIMKYKRRYLKSIDTIKGNIKAIHI